MSPGPTATTFAPLSPDSLPLDEDEQEALSEEGVVWRTIPGFPRYEASSQGVIVNWHYPEGKRVDPPQGKTVFYDANGVKTSQIVGSMVARTFLTPCPEGHRLRYVDHNPRNTAVSNLCWEALAAQAERNLGHLIKNRRDSTHCFRGHELAGDNVKHNDKNGRWCVTCARAFETARSRRRKQVKKGLEPTWTVEDILLERGQIEFDVLLQLW